MLGSARSPEFAQDSGIQLRSAICAARHRSACRDRRQWLPERYYRLDKAGFAVVGIASTIDNDLYGTDITIGCDTAVNLTLEAFDRLRTTASSHQRAFLVETMGRNCGYIAMMTGISGWRRGDRHARMRGGADRNVIERLSAA